MDVILTAPALTLDEALECARNVFGITAAGSVLPSERDQNVLLEADNDRRRFVLKIANASEKRELLDAQNDALAYVARRTPLCPRAVSARDGSTIAEFVARTGVRHYVRVLTWLPGLPLGAVADQSTDLLEDVGRAVAELDAALDGFDHPAIHRDFHWDLAKGISIVEELAPLVDDPEMRALVTRAAAAIATRDGARFERLRRAAVHNDPNDYNILVDDRRVTGILDFGDIVHSFAIADLAIATAYATLGKAEPLEAAVHVARGYQRVKALDEDELASLFGLVLLRLCASVCVAARQQKQRPDDPYLSISQQPIRETLPRLAALDPSRVEAALRAVRAPTPEETLSARRRVIGPNLSVAYRAPVKIVRGWMQYLYDGSGRRYLDAYNNVPHVGHSHPRVVRAGTDQMRLLNTNTRYLHDLLGQFGERLTATLPDPLRVCYFVNSGSEANELALRLARAHTGRRDVVVLDAAYHGNTSTLIDISPYKFNGPGGEGAAPWVHVLPLPDIYRGKYRRGDPRAGEKYAEFARQVRNPAAFIAESAPSVGGQIILPDRYLASVYAIVRAAGGVCIADEVQTAYGRMGTHFYAFEAQNVVPDIVVLGKPIGNGYPLGAVVTTREIAASFDNGMEFFSTFGGSTVSCAVGLAVLQVVQDERLQEHARQTGERLLERLRALQAVHPLMGDVRGSGLFLGVELVKDRSSLEPATEEAREIVNRLRDRAILLGTDGPFANVLKIRPPMPFSDDDGEHVASALDEVLAGL
ncbi:MAG TPA: aminotransferase class III-fold pyridoxal phosphate-dependent enzyme [Vicinamibacterales bacterium]|nr:aminotransferase class III-fold pyridoxal phosphate-dependent enzyme [Vicinamibacterales bacterium]